MKCNSINDDDDKKFRCFSQLFLILMLVIQLKLNPFRIYEKKLREKGEKV